MTNYAKVKVNKETFDALESMKREFSSHNKEELMVLHLNGWNKLRDTLNYLSILEFANILFHGYELELTKEEKLAETYGELLLGSRSDADRWIAEGIYSAVLELELEIKVVNK